MTEGQLFLGVDGGGTHCRARLADRAGRVLGEGLAGPANIRLGSEASLAAVLKATRQCLAAAHYGEDALAATTACLALAGASEPAEHAAATAQCLPFRRALITTDAHAACVGAHRGRDGGIVIAGTGSVGWAVIDGRHYRVGGWGLPLSDEGSGAWLGGAALRRVLLAYDGRIAWTALLRRLFETFAADPHAIVRWAAHATPGDFASLAPEIVEHAGREDAEAARLMRRAARQLDRIALRLVALGAARVALMGGLAPCLEPLLAAGTRKRLVAPEGDALSGALDLARSLAAEA